LVFEVFRTEDGDFDEEKFTADAACFGIIQYSPYWYEIFELATGLLETPS
jgi:hypothetical protein